MHYYTIRNGVGTIRVSHLQAQYLVDGEVIHRCRKCSSDSFSGPLDLLLHLIREQEIYA